MTTNTMARNPAPENRGRPAMPCATPMLKGLAMAALNPKPVDSRLMPRPVSESQPMDHARATTMGIRGTVSSKSPSRAPSAMKNRQVTAIRTYLRVRNRVTMAAMSVRTTPAWSRTAKLPPTSRMNRMMVMTVTASLLHSTSTGAVNQRQTGRGAPCVNRKDAGSRTSCPSWMTRS